MWDFDVAGRVVRMRFAGEGLVPLITPALEHLRIDQRRTIPTSRSRSSTRSRPASAWSPRRGTGLPTGGRARSSATTTSGPAPSTNPASTSSRSSTPNVAAGVYWSPSYRFIPWWETSFPMRVGFHWWSSTTPSLQPMHAGAVGRDDGGVLIAGRGGAGKSTTSLACLDGGMLYAGDDYTLVDVDRPMVYGLYNTAKLRPENLDRFPHLAELVDNADALETQKAMLFLHRHRPESAQHGLPRAGDRAAACHRAPAQRSCPCDRARRARRRSRPPPCSSFRARCPNCSPR